jgi:hypothetical protein
LNWLFQQVKISNHLKQSLLEQICILAWASIFALGFTDLGVDFLREGEVWQGVVASYEASAIPLGASEENRVDFAVEANFLNCSYWTLRLFCLF